MSFWKAAFAFASICLTPALLGQQPTVTTLSITSGGVPIATVSQQTPVTLTATVLSGNSLVTRGQVAFCDVKALPLKCTDIRLLGTAQLSSSGTAVFEFYPSVGTHTYQAVFLGTHTAASSSVSQNLVVTPHYTDFTTVQTVKFISSGTYSFVVKVTGTGTTSPTGTVSILDSSNGNYVLGTAPVVAGPPPSGGVVSPAPPGFSTIGYTPEEQSGAQSGSGYIAVADLNGDGKNDILSGSYAGSGSVLLGNGDGTFSFTPNAALGGTNLCVADFNGDGKPDVAVLTFGAYTVPVTPKGYSPTYPLLFNPGSQGNVAISLGNGDGTFSAAKPLPLSATPAPTFAAVGDFNGDGIPDLAIANATTYQGTPINAVYILLGNGDGTFTQRSIAATGARPVAITVGDFNNDGILDMAVANADDNTISILLGNGDGAFHSLPAFPSTGFSSEPSYLVVADFNGDGTLDLAVANAGSIFEAGIPQQSIAVLLGNGNGTFTPNYEVSNGWYGMSSLAVGDFNADGKPDLLFDSYFVSDYAMLGNGDGTFGTAIDLGGTGYPGGVAAADFNGDGVTDAGISTQEIPPPEIPNALDVFLAEPNTQNATANSTVGPFFVVGTGPHNLIASYTGDNNYAPSVSTAEPVTAEPEPTTLAFTAAPSTINYSQAVTLSAIVSPIAAENHSATGSVTFTLGNTMVGTAAINAAGVATFTTSMLPSGTDAVTATYSGDANFATSSATATETVIGSQSVTALSIGPNPAKPLQAVTFSATVTGIGFPQTPTGSVSFYNGATVLAQEPLNAAGMATYTTSSLQFGNYPITAVYSGDPAYYSSTSTPVALVITGYVSTTMLTVSPSPGNGGQTVTLTATLAGVGTTLVPTGTVTFFAGATPLGSAQINASGLAVYTTTTLATGVDSLTASYPGSAEFTASTSAPVTETIIKPDFSIALAAPGITLAKYQNTTTTITLASIGAFADTVTFSCSNLPAYLTCMPTPVSTPLTANGSVTASLYLDTDSIIGGYGKSGPLARSGPRAPATLAFVLLPAFALAFRRRRRGLRFALVMACLALPVVVGMTSCGGSIITPVPGVGPGVYTIPITATGTSSGLVHAAQLTLTVTP